ncbi:MAG: hypothetical protein V4819_20215 [Verrucomicrobiota bacterium]
MSAKRKKKKPEYVPVTYDVAALAKMIQEWEELRRVRDLDGWNRQMSELILKQITGKRTALEALHGMLNAYEEAGEVEFQKWRKSLNFEPPGEDSAPVRRDLSAQIYQFHELLRAVMASGDKELIKAWLAERSWSESILIPLMLSQKPTGEIITS